MSLKDRVEALLSTADTYEDFNDSCKQFEDIKATFEAFNAIKSAQIKENHADADTMQVENSHSFGSSWSGYKPMHTSYQWNRT
ncbi:hypothetical protein QNE34_003615 [Vibrio vulnificus]|nr:hypothetical protein [Vibrio vulnificus]EJB5268817.1 hypothetical protein [Vibrio vulnificus]ELV8767680.1 hypothetical protein [Vibrio vulnificus]